MYLRLLTLGALLFGMVSLSAGADDETKTKELFKDPEKIFEKMDADSDKKVTKEEFKKFFTSLGKGQLGDKAGPLLDGMFDKLDADKSGSLSLEEYKKLREMRKLDPEKLKELKEKLKKKKAE